MNTLTSLVLAFNPVLFAIRPRRQASSGDVLVYLGIAVVVIAVLCAGIYALNRMAHTRRFNSHSSLFSGLCQTHGLDRSDRVLLKSLVAFHNLDYPSRVFSEPQWLTPDRLPPALKSNEEQIRTLHKRLFT